MLRTQWAMVTVTGLPGIAAVIALIFTFITLHQSQAALNITEQGQITDRYNAAVTNLGSATIDIRLGGIYALQRIMTDSPRDQPAIISILSAFIRVHDPIPAYEANTIPMDPPPPLKPDIAAALHVLASRTAAHDGGNVIDLSNTYLAGTDLANADLRGANLASADLRSANLSNAYLAGTDLASADLRSANLASANLASADLRSANLAVTDLAGAELSGADLVETDLSATDLAGSDISVQQVTKARPNEATTLPDQEAADPRVRKRIAEVARNET
ncbi:pentapeptide repeat-containing protein [Streptomyces sp. NPDC101234]|uniref:pentapeptide repeat-containing protein n=1 Tax=Streptomyces sp. NPDC101234 TaxID=3366138 RepID=UPI0037F9030E